MRASVLTGALALGLAVQPPAGAQTVTGRVTDRASSRPVAGVPVVLLDASFQPLTRARSDSLGLYVLRPGGPGIYFVQVERPGLAAPLSEPIALRGSELFDHPIEVGRVPAPRFGPPALDLRAADVVGACGPLFDGRRHGIVVGQVSDPGTAMTLEQVWVSGRAVAHVSTAAEGRHEARTGQDGLYVFCDLPAGARMRFRAAGGGRVGSAREVVVTGGEVRRVDLALPLTERGADGDVLGRITDAASGKGIDGVEVRIRDTGRWAVTDPQGHFALDSVPAGLHVFEVRRIGYGTREVAFRVEAGGAHGVRIPLTQEAVTLEPIVVTVRSREWGRAMRGLQHRMRVGAGVFLTREDLERLRPARLVDLLRNVPGLRVRATPERDGAPAVRVRGLTCAAEVVVDRAPRRDPGLLTALRATDLEAVEIYRGPAEDPGVYGTGGRCGTVLVWTRSWG